MSVCEYCGCDFNNKYALGPHKRVCWRNSSFDRDRSDDAFSASDGETETANPQPRAIDLATRQIDLRQLAQRTCHEWGNRVSLLRMGQTRSNDAKAVDYVQVTLPYVSLSVLLCRYIEVPV